MTSCVTEGPEKRLEVTCSSPNPLEDSLPHRSQRLVGAANGPQSSATSLQARALADRIYCDALHLTYRL